jgi:hypothetical protein
MPRTANGQHHHEAAQHGPSSYTKARQNSKKGSWCGVECAPASSAVPALMTGDPPSKSDEPFNFVAA